MSLAGLSGSNTIYTSLSDSIKPQYRQLKMGVISDEIKFNINLDSWDESMLNFIASEFKNDIISGSTALRMYGLISRTSKDLDIIIKDKSRYTGYSTDSYNDNEILDNRLGFKKFNYNTESSNKFLQFFGAKKSIEILVDFFEFYDGVSCNEIQYKGNVFRLHDPLQIIDAKIDMIDDSSKVDISEKRKHYRDIIDIFTSTKVLEDKVI